MMSRLLLVDLQGHLRPSTSKAIFSQGSMKFGWVLCRLAPNLSSGDWGSN